MNMLLLRFAAALALLLAACVEPPVVETKVIVGGTLIDGVNAPLPHSVIVIREGRIAAAGPQQSTPIPAGSEKTDGSGKYVAAANRGMRIEPGAPADLLLLSANPLERPENYEKIERRMIAGKWLDK